jgi:hypothetical protein
MDTDTDTDTNTDTLEHLPPAPPQGVRRFFQFNLRSLFWAITFWSVLVVVFTRLGLVEALEAVLALTALLVLTTWFHREFSVERRRLPALLTVLHVLVTLLAVVIALVATRASESWTWQGIATWTAAGVLMFPVALLHHFVCLFFGWHSGLAQPRHVPARGRVEFVAVGQCVAVATRTATAVTGTDKGNGTAHGLQPASTGRWLHDSLWPDEAIRSTPKNATTSHYES